MFIGGMSRERGDSDLSQTAPSKSVVNMPETIEFFCLRRTGGVIGVVPRRRKPGVCSLKDDGNEPVARARREPPEPSAHGQPRRGGEAVGRAIDGALPFSVG